MLYSKLFGKTKKEAPKDEVSRNAQLLIKAGYVQKEIAGVYALMPLGKKVADNIIQVIREEMEAIGGQEVYLGSLQNPEIWKKTDRWDDQVMDVWFKSQLKSGAEVGLASTHEEPLSTIMADYVKSYKDLPFYIFQIQNKFRNELRAKSGLLRTREFIMKDLYSFNKTTGDLDEFYEKAKEAYHKIFDRLGIGDRTYLTFASGGVFSKYSHEFQTLCEAGEDTIYLDKNKELAVNEEVYTDEVLNELGLDKSDLEEVTATEVGNIFKLGTKYSEPLGLLYADSKGNKQPVVMGCYGIGVQRVMAAIVEVYNDEGGIIWPENIAPYKVHLVGLNLDEDVVRENAREVYRLLEDKGIATLFDDREDTSAGEKFANADLIGVPYRVVVSKRMGDMVEVKKRSQFEETPMSLDKLVEFF